MGILDRVSRIIRANVSDLLDSGVSASQAFGEILISMKTDLREAVRQHTSVRTEINRIDGLIRGAGQGVEKYRSLAMEAMERRDETEARRHLVRSRRQKALVESLDRERKSFTDLAEKLDLAIEALKARIDEITIRQSMIQARERQNNIASMDSDNRDYLNETIWDGLEELDMPPLSSVDPVSPGKRVDRVADDLSLEDQLAGSDPDVEQELSDLREKIRKG